MHRVSVCIAETNTYIRSCAVKLLYYYVVHIPVEGRKKIFRQCRKVTTCRYAIYQLKHLHTKVHSSHTTSYPAHNSHEATLVVGEHTERMPAVPVGEHCAGLMGVGETAAVKGNRATHLKLCGGSLGQLLVHKRTTS